MTHLNLTPSKMKCFEAVEGVIGYADAVQELWKVLDSGIPINGGRFLIGAFTWSDTPQGHDFWSLINKGERPAFQSSDTEYTGGTAPDFLHAALSHMQERAATYDAPQGERSMGKTVTAFNALTGHDLTEEQGWLFMQVLKAARTQQGAFRADNYEDGAAYVALMGEAAARERGND